VPLFDTVRWARHAASSSAVALLLAACAAPTPKPVQKYVAPAAGQTAKLVMRGAVPAGDVYSVYYYADSEKCTGLRSVGAGNSTRNPLTTTLAANQITTIEFFVVKSAKNYCSVRYSFTPLAGKTYLLSGASIDKGCTARVMDMGDPEHLKPELGALRRNPTGLACLPLSQSRAASVAGHESAQSSGEAVLREGAGSDDLQGLINQ
jgi:hypothetical protein